MLTPDPLLRLAGAIAAHFARVKTAEPAIQEAVSHLLASALRAQHQSFVDVPHGYGELVARAVECGCNSSVAAIASHLLPVHSSLPWVYHYAPRSADEDLGDRIAFAELIGPDGPLLAPRCRVGFTVIAERTAYPWHSHPAVELYLVISGHAQWQTPTSNRLVPPGELVLHRSNEAHAMRTFDEPLLALWGWTGDLDAPAAYL